MVSAEPQPQLLVIVGATGTGKSELALESAQRLLSAGRRAEIVGADAMQLYRGMDIGTAKLPVARRLGIPHHMIDELTVTEEASVAWYQPRARAAIDAILARNAVPILVGGSGLYVSSVLYDFDFPPRDLSIRQRLEAELSEGGAAALYRRLVEESPDTAERIDPANPRRIIRALELIELGEDGRVGTLPESPRPWRAAHIVGLHIERPTLVERLDARVERMWSGGLLDEVAALREVGIERSVTARRAIGYAQALDTLQGRMSEPDARAATGALTRRYARRQVSWFRRYRDVHWIDPAARTHPEDLAREFIPSSSA